MTLIAHIVRPAMARALASARPMVSAGLDRSLLVVSRGGLYARQFQPQARQAAAVIGRVSATVSLGAGAVATYDYCRTTGERLEGKRLDEVDWKAVLADSGLLALTLMATLPPAGAGAAARAALGVGASIGGTLRDMTLGDKTFDDLWSPEAEAGTHSAAAGVASAILGEIGPVQVLGGMAGIYSAARGLQDSRALADVRTHGPALLSDTVALGARWAAQAESDPETAQKVFMVSL